MWLTQVSANVYALYAEHPTTGVKVYLGVFSLVEAEQLWMQGLKDRGV